MTRALLLVALLAVSACCGDDTQTGTVPATIQDIKFAAAHLVEHCGAKTGCHYDSVEDQWKILVCTDEEPGKRRCDTFTRQEAPWEWQTVGASVIATWGASDCRSWHMDKISKPI